METVIYWEPDFFLALQDADVFIKARVVHTFHFLTMVRLRIKPLQCWEQGMIPQANEWLLDSPLPEKKMLQQFG